MYRPLHSTKRCELFNTLSKVIWDELSDYYQQGCDSSEVGITKYIIREFNRFSSSIIRNFQLYAKPGHLEAVYGSDIDVFLGIGGGRYIWFALQAKLLKSNGRYTTMKDGYSTTNLSYQWEKLTLLEAASAGCKSYYLFYNGVIGGFKYSGIDHCNQSFGEKDFGCSLVETNKIKADMDARMKGVTYHNPTFKDYHPSLAMPWRTLVCCPHSMKLEEFTPYYREDVEGAVEGYERIGISFESDTPENRNIRAMEQNFIRSELNYSRGNRPKDLMPIITSSNEVGWRPEYKVIVNTTTDSIKNV